MATSTSPLAGLVATASADVNTLGFLAWYSLPDHDVSLRRLRRAWVAAGLDPTPLPKDPKAINVFKRAVRSQEGRVREGERIIETDVREVGETSGPMAECVYQISRVVRDLDERVIEYPKALRVILNKTTEEVTFNALGGVPQSEVLPMMTAISEFIDESAKKVTGPNVRSLVRRYITEDDDKDRGMVGLSGEPMGGSLERKGSPYFVIAKHSEALEALVEMLAEVYPDGRGNLHAVPMADGATERELVRRHHVANTVNEIKAAIGEAADLIREDRARGVRSNVQDHHWARLRRLQRRAAEYNRLLGDEQDEVNTMAEMLNKQLKKLAGT